ncbi:DUF6087 family protein [Streptomyces fimicarius]|uniref:DUF6087 family protein n=1 Tax=Streptomyces griseus TaxID=1911 RepID=UPI0036A609B1
MGWARRRDARQTASKGKHLAVPLSEGPHREAHVDPGVPRAIEEWTGTDWTVIGVVESLAAAQALLYPQPPVQEKPAEWDRPAMGGGGVGTENRPRRRSGTAPRRKGV